MTQPTAAMREAMAQAGADQSILRQDSDDSASIPKGYTDLPAGRAMQSAINIMLNKSADVSTAIHELGHAPTFNPASEADWNTLAVQAGQGQTCPCHG